MKKICIFLPSLRGGGAERVTLILANGMAEKGYNVDLVLAKAEGPYLHDVSIKVNIVDLGKTRMLSSLFPFIKYLKRSKPDSILSVMNHVNIIAYLAKFFSGSRARLIFSEHNNLSTSMLVNQSYKNFTLKKLMVWAYKRADAVVAVSNGVADDLADQLHMQRSSIMTIYNPVVTKELLQLQHEKIEHPWIGEGKDFIIGVGRLTYQKNFALLIDAFYKVQNNHDLSLVILGEGELEGDLKSQISDLGLEDKVLMPGFVGNPYAWIKASRCFVLSSVHEGLPTVLIEAMACGTPVVSTDCPSGPSEILEGGRWGKLVPLNDSDSLSRAISDTLVDGRNDDAQKERANDFRTDSSVAKYLEIV